MKQHGEFWLWFSLCLLVLVCPAEMFGQSTGCSGREREAALRSDAQVYRDAMALSESLGKNGIQVNCVLGSTMEATFEGQIGAAAYRSNHGSFEVLFLPQAGSFDRLTIFEQRKGERYSYRFKGPPQPWPANLIDSAYRIYFIKNRNMLFVVDNDAGLAANLQKFVHSQH
jgi:hypothetical protein